MGPGSSSGGDVNPPTSTGAEAPHSSGDLDSLVAQRLKALTKRDPTTRLKALRGLRELLSAEGSEADAAAALPAWAFVYPKLVTDNNRCALAVSKLLTTPWRSIIRRNPTVSYDWHCSSLAAQI